MQAKVSFSSIFLTYQTISDAFSARCMPPTQADIAASDDSSDFGYPSAFSGSDFESDDSFPQSQLKMDQYEQNRRLREGQSVGGDVFLSLLSKSFIP